MDSSGFEGAKKQNSTDAGGAREAGAEMDAGVVMEIGT
jgi:hypothetical protein